MTNASTTRRTRYGRRTWGRAEALGVDPEPGRWAVVCEDHATIVNVGTREQAARTHTSEFCEECTEPEQARC